MDQTQIYRLHYGSPGYIDVAEFRGLGILIPEALMITGPHGSTVDCPQQSRRSVQLICNPDFKITLVEEDGHAFVLSEATRKEAERGGVTPEAIQEHLSKTKTVNYIQEAAQIVEQWLESHRPTNNT